MLVSPLIYSQKCVGLETVRKDDINVISLSSHSAFSDHRMANAIGCREENARPHSLLVQVFEPSGYKFLPFGI